jgi:hypothetical protein
MRIVILRFRPMSSARHAYLTDWVEVFFFLRNHSHERFGDSEGLATTFHPRDHRRGRPRQLCRWVPQLQPDNKSKKLTSFSIPAHWDVQDRGLMDPFDLASKNSKDHPESRWHSSPGCTGSDWKAPAFRNNYSNPWLFCPDGISNRCETLSVGPAAHLFKYTHPARFDPPFYSPAQILLIRYKVQRELRRHHIFIRSLSVHTQYIRVSPDHPVIG